MAELKFCIWSQMVNTYHWWKFQVKRHSRTWVPEGGPRVFYRPVCKVPNDHVTNFFRTLIDFIDQFGWLEQFSAKFIEPITLIPHLGFRPPIWTFWSVKYQPDRWPTQIFANNLVLSYITLGQNFKFVAFVVFEILGGGLEAPPKTLRLAKKRKTREGLRLNPAKANAKGMLTLEGASQKKSLLCLCNDIFDVKTKIFKLRRHKNQWTKWAWL